MMKRLRKWLMLETLGQRVALAVETFIMNRAMLFILLFLIIVVIADFYNRYIRINQNADDIDLMKEYNNLQLRRKYKL
jgi:hypothetical protein